VYRDGTPIANVTGDTFDDYDLQPGRTYSYSVKAYALDPLYKKESLSAVSQPVSATPFIPTGSLQGTKDNSDPASNLGSSGAPSGFHIGSTYYSYRTDGTGTINIQERSSSDGLTNWSAWNTLLPLADSKLEGVGFYQVGNKVALVAHHEDAATYNLGNLYLASIVPGASCTETFRGHPFNNESRDLSVFIDDDGKAYVISAGLQDLGIYQLTEDWTGLAGSAPVNIVLKGERRETPYIVRQGASYFLFSSEQSGWYPSQAKYSTSTSLSGAWSDLRELGNRAFSGSQFNYVAQYGTDRKTYGAYGYHWGNQYHHKEGSDYNYTRLMPLAFNGDFVAANYFSEVAYYPTHGLVGIQAGRLLSQGAPVVVSSADAVYGNKYFVNDGADSESAGYFRAGAYPYNLLLDLKKSAIIKEVNLITNLVNGSETAYKYTVEGSADGLIYTMISDNSSNWSVGFTINTITDSTAYRYIRFTVNGIVNVSNGDASATWADGVIELAVFGTPAE
jgi:hypothetical protein